MKIQYDHCGRMKYNPTFHQNNGTPWNEEDTEYLIKWYDIVGADEMSFALGRTAATIMNKVQHLRAKGIMQKPLKRKWCRRIIDVRC